MNPMHSVKGGSEGVPVKLGKLNIERDGDGINLDVDGAPEGIYLDPEIIPLVVRVLAVLGDVKAVSRAGTRITPRADTCASQAWCPWNDASQWIPSRSGW